MRRRQQHNLDQRSGDGTTSPLPARQAHRHSGPDHRTGSHIVSQRTFLYRLFDAEDRLLYVGITNQPRRRFHHHRTTKTWWADVARHELETHPNREVASAAEIAAITGEHPVHNVVHNRAGSFTAWLRTQTKRPDRIGAFASDMRADPQFPRPGTVETALTYFEERGEYVDLDEMAGILYDAWTVFRLGDREPTIARSGRFGDGTPWWSDQLSILTRISADTVFPVGLTDDAVSEVGNHNERVIPTLRAEGYEGDIWHGPGPATPVLLTHTDDAPAALQRLERLIVDSHKARDRQFGPDDLLGDP